MSKEANPASGCTGPSSCSLFGGEGSEEYNAVYGAIAACGQDAARCGETDERDAVYGWLENTPRTSLVVELVNKLHDMGFRIFKANVDLNLFRESYSTS